MNKWQEKGAKEKGRTRGQPVPPENRAKTLLEIDFLEAEPGLREVEWCREKKLWSRLGVRRPDRHFHRQWPVLKSDFTRSSWYLQVTGGRWVKSALLPSHYTFLRVYVCKLLPRRDALLQRVQLSYPNTGQNQVKPIFHHTQLSSQEQVIAVMQFHSRNSLGSE